MDVFLNDACDLCNKQCQCQSVCLSVQPTRAGIPNSIRQPSQTLNNHQQRHVQSSQMCLLLWLDRDEAKWRVEQLKFKLKASFICLKSLIRSSRSSVFQFLKLPHLSFGGRLFHEMRPPHPQGAYRVCAGQRHRVTVQACPSRKRPIKIFLKHRRDWRCCQRKRCGRDLELTRRSPWTVFHSERCKLCWLGTATGSPWLTTWNTCRVGERGEGEKQTDVWEKKEQKKNIRCFIVDSTVGESKTQHLIIIFFFYNCFYSSDRYWANITC